MGRTHSLLGVLAAAVIAFSGCVEGPDRTPAATGGALDGGEPVSGDWLVFAREGEPDHLNLIVSSNVYSSEIWRGAVGSFVGEGLLGYDPETWRVARPLLAESYPEISDDGLTYTFTMREGVQWHDGEPFSSADVLFSIKATMLPFVDSAAKRGYFAELRDVEVEGRQVRFRMDQPYWLNAEVLGFELPILPQHVFDPEGVLDGYSYPEIVGAAAADNAELRAWGEAFNRHPANRTPIGTGPFKFERWESGAELVLTRNEDYWGQKAYLDGIVYRFISDLTAALTAVRAGEADLFARLTPIQWAQQTDGPEFESELAKTTYQFPSYGYIGWNAERPYFEDKRVRQAMTMLVPRQQILDTVRFGLGRVAVSDFHPGSPDFNPNIEPLPYDPDRAVELLEEAGWVDTNGNGIRDKDGVEFQFRFDGAIGSSVFDQLVPVMREELGRAGIDMTDRRLEFTTMVANAIDHQFDALLMGWVAGLYHDPYQLWHSSSADNGGSNYVSFRNAEADRLIEQARTEFDPERRRELYWEFQELLSEEQPYTFMFYTEEGVAYSRRFRGVEWIPPFPGFDLTRWWVPADLQRFAGVRP